MIHTTWLNALRGVFGMSRAKGKRRRLFMNGITSVETLELRQFLSANPVAAEISTIAPTDTSFVSPDSATSAASSVTAASRSAMAVASNNLANGRMIRTTSPTALPGTINSVASRLPAIPTNSPGTGTPNSVADRLPAIPTDTPVSGIPNSVSDRTPAIPTNSQITGANITGVISGSSSTATQVSPTSASMTSSSIPRTTRDLAAVSVTAPNSAQWGSEFDVTVQIRNAGRTTISSYQYGFTLNTSRNVRAYVLGDLQSRNVTLLPGQTDTFTARVRLSSSSTVPYTSYYLGASIVAENGDPTGNNRTASAYRIRVLAPPATQPVVRFDTESNNSMSQANFVKDFGRGTHSNTFYGSTGSGSDTQDWFKFKVGGTTSGSITLSGMTRDLDLELYNSSGSRIASSTRSGTSTDAINLNSLGSGDYFVRVTPYGSGSGSAYALRFGLTVS
jgi:hypothetical protein